MTAVAVDDLSKRFRLTAGRATSLKERALRGKQRYEEFWALRNISFELSEGQTLGLLGHNGSGKSTLLKCITGILKPTSGQALTKGRIASLLELGAGFHPELTGRENVFINASFLGIPTKEIERRFDDIVEFAELEHFIDQQVKYYSSGMFVRLGFSVAVNVDPDILLVDEVLAVGDENFQRKCLEKVREFQHDGRTILVVSHAADLMRQVADKVAVIDRGNLVAFDDPGPAIRVFREHLLEDQRQREASVASRQAAALAEVESPHANEPVVRRAGDWESVRITSVELSSVDGRTHVLQPGDPLRVDLILEAAEPVRDIVVGVAVYDGRDGRPMFGANTDLLGVDLRLELGSNAVTFTFESVPLLDGTFFLTIGAHSHDESHVYDWSENEHRFEVVQRDRSWGTIAVPTKVRFTDVVR